MCTYTTPTPVDLFQVACQDQECVCTYTTPTSVDLFQVACQDQEEDEDEQQAEYDGMLIESAGDVLPVMARLMGGPTFSPFFASFLTDLLKRLVSVCLDLAHRCCKFLCVCFLCAA